MTRGELISELAASLGARHEARFIVEEVLGPPSPGDDRMAGPADVETARTLTARRRAGEPLQYVLGHWAFRSLDLLVDRRVLIPRPETEQVVEVALGEIGRLGTATPTVVDAGTGSGAIALSLATELAHGHPDARLWGTEASPDALAVARGEPGPGAPAARRARPARAVRGRELAGPASLADCGARSMWSCPIRPTSPAAEWPDLSGEVRREPVAALVGA